MNIKTAGDFIDSKAQQLIGSVREAFPSGRQAARKPLLLGYLLIRVHRAQIALVLSLLFLIFLAPDIVDKITGTLFPPQTSKKVFGLIKTSQVNPFKGVADIFILITLWIIWIGSAFFLFLLNIREGIARADALAGKLFEKACSSTDQSRRRRLFILALSITTDKQLESKIERSSQTGTIIEGSVIHGDITQIAISTKPGWGHELSSTDSPKVPRRKSYSSQAIGAQGRYVLVAEVGKGAMGVVYEGWDNILERKIAIKQLANFISDDESYAARFRREARTLARMIHINIVQVYDLIVDHGRLWMALEFVEGGNLASFLKDRGFLSVDETSKIAIPVAQGLAHAHEQGVVHRDLKPANILLTRNHTPKISDFGIAKISESSELTQVGSVLGSPPYMSPEQCTGGLVDFKTDVYALGITLYKLLTGKVPFEGDTSSVMARHISESPRPISETRSDIPGDLEDLISQMLAKNPDDRPSSLIAVVERLSSIINVTAAPKQ
jgi:tRNA A-37 threonylcarbamoyl transferase component Bud32